MDSIADWKKERRNLVMDNTDYSARSISILLGTEDEILLHGQFLDSFYRKKMIMTGISF